MQEDEHWRQLCARISNEKDLENLLALVYELNQELEKRKALNGSSPDAPTHSRKQE